MRHLLRRAKPADGMNGDQRLFGTRRIGAASSGSDFRRKRAGDGGADA